MKRRNFIKTLAAAMTVPVVAAKAIAASHKKRGILDYKPTHAYSLRKLTALDIPYDPRVAHYDQSGNGNHLYYWDAPLSTSRREAIEKSIMEHYGIK